MLKLGLDMGTKNIVLAHRLTNGTVKFKREVNGFISIERPEKYAIEMLRDLKVPYIERGDAVIALGIKAEEMAVTFGKRLLRPMEDGTISTTQYNAMEIIAVMVKGLIGKLDDDATIYYSIPAAAINKETNIGFHEKIIALIINSISDKTIKVKPINEARALVLSSSDDKTAIGISMGAGMINVAYCLYGLPVYEFSIVGAGDKIDKEAARVTGNLDEDGKQVAFVSATKERMSFEDDKIPSDPVERAIYINYELMIQNIAKGIIDGFNKNKSKAQLNRPIPIIIGGGTASPKGFKKLFERAWKAEKMPFEVGAIEVSSNPLYAVANGCLIAAEYDKEE